MLTIPIRLIDPLNCFHVSEIATKKKKLKNASMTKVFFSLFSVNIITNNSLNDKVLNDLLYYTRIVLTMCNVC